MPEFTFNTEAVTVHPSTGITADDDAIQHVPQLRRASLSKAILFGGPPVAAALQQCPLSGDREHVLVDTKVTFLMPGWIPAIPGWHTDGVPRGDNADPAGKGIPRLTEQLRQSNDGVRPLFHSFFLGDDALPEFLSTTTVLNIESPDDYTLYTEVSRKVDALGDRPKVSYFEGQWSTWDWWNLHRAIPATRRGWRLHIRVTESAVPPSETDFIRPQTQVYVPYDFGW